MHSSCARVFLGKARSSLRRLPHGLALLLFYSGLGFKVRFCRYHVACVRAPRCPCQYISNLPSRHICCLQSLSFMSLVDLDMELAASNCSCDTNLAHDHPKIPLPRTGWRILGA